MVPLPYLLESQRFISQAAPVAVAVVPEVAETNLFMELQELGEAQGKE
ncbi:hypothetical protein [Pantoea agglomerans]|nr:hypothetical protein [Pantoea agglomerans]MBD8133710.1 hypothetical protein [Pantoea agglomerans]